MDIQELLAKGANVSLTVGVADLREFAQTIIADARRELEQAVIEDKAETYPSPKQVCEILGVDASTLWRWAKRNYLVPVEVGGKRRYKMSEVKALLNGNRRASK